MAVQVIGLRVINQTLARSGPLIYKAARAGMLEAAEPVRRDAGRLSQTQISGMRRARRQPPPWSINKRGATQAEVYIVPKEKGRRFYRTDGDRRRAEKFVRIMYGKAYDPALERNEVLVRDTVDAWLGRVTRSL